MHLLGYVYSSALIPGASTATSEADSHLHLGGTVRCDAVLLGDGGQLFQELGVQDDGEHSALGLWGNGRAGGQDGERRQSQSVPHKAVGKRRVQDDVAALRLEAL